MKIITVIIRILLGLVFVVFGSNAFLHFIPMPPMHGAAGEFMGAMFTTGYLQVIASFQILGGLLLLIGYVPLGLLVLGPIIVNIVLFHLLMNRDGLPLALAVFVLSIFLLWRYRASYAGILRT